jgi:hypothetical protein
MSIFVDSKITRMKIKLLTVHFISTILFTLTVSAQLSGNYTINSAQPTGGTNFQTFNDLAASLNTTGVSGNVVATVTPGSGPYHEQVSFINIPGTGAGATVTLDGSGETITALTNSIDRFVVRLWDVHFFTINNLRVVRDTSSISGFYGIHIYNSGSNITVSNCSVDMSGSTSTLVGGYIASGSMTSILDSGDFHFINIINDTATGGGYGASVYGMVTSLATDIVISGNTFLDWHSNGVYLRETNGAEISYNYLNKRTSNVTSCNAIQIAQAANINARIFNNYITVHQTSNGTMTIKGIYLFNGTGHKVYNNIINDIQLVSGNFTGIEVRTGSTAPEISFNTIALENTGVTSGNLYGITEELSNTNSVLRNNIISITQNTTGEKVGLVLGAISTVTTALNSDYNLIWVPNGSVAMKNSSSPVYYTLLSDWQVASTQDANSLMMDPQFFSTALAQPTNTNADNMGTPVAGITTDFAGNLRATPPDIGAYEFPAPTAISEADKTNMTVYPNPFTSEIYIRTENSTDAEFVLYNLISGIQKIVRVSNNSTINTSELPAGLYFYELRGENQVLSKGKLIKQ